MYIPFWNIVNNNLMTFLFFSNDFYLLIPEIFILFMLFVFIILFVSWDAFHKQHIILIRSVQFLILYSLLLLLFLYLNIITINFIGFNFYFISNYYIYIFKIFLLFMCALFVISCFDKNINVFEFKWEFFLVFLISIIGLIFLCSSYDFILFYLSLELYSLSIYVLVTWNVLSPFSTEAGLKYFILGSFASGLLLLGLSFIYLSCGTLNFEDLTILLYTTSFISFQNNLIILGIIFISVGLFFKLGIAPFHMWTPDVYEGAPYIVTMLMAILPKIVLVNVIYRIFFCIFFEYSQFWIYISSICCLLSFIIGALGAIYQIKIKRILAYSAINNAGFFLLALCCNSFFGYFGGLLYIVIYSIILFGLFIFFLMLVPFSSENRSNEPFIYIGALANMFLTNPVLGYSGSLLLLSLAGIPPLMGFFGKFVIFFASLEVSLFFIGCVSMLLTVITSFYYLRLVKIFFFEQKNIFFLASISRVSSLLLGLILFINIIFFLIPEYFLIIVYNLTLSLYI